MKYIYLKHLFCPLHINDSLRNHVSKEPQYFGYVIFNFPMITLPNFVSYVKIHTQHHGNSLTLILLLTLINASFNNRKLFLWIWFYNIVVLYWISQNPTFSKGNFPFFPPSARSLQTQVYKFVTYCKWGTV